MTISSPVREMEDEALLSGMETHKPAPKGKDATIWLLAVFMIALNVFAWATWLLFTHQSQRLLAPQQEFCMLKKHIHCVEGDFSC